MTIESLQQVIDESGRAAQVIAEAPSQDHVANEAAAAQWMQVKMLAEIALQLRVMNDGNGARQPGE